MNHIKLAFLLASIVVLASCTISKVEPTGTPLAPPPELLDLPRIARMRCSDNSRFNEGNFVVWELPGIEPSDKDSAYRGNRGKDLGRLPPCTVIKITDYTWSETDREFWIYITTDTLEGWVTLDIVDLKP